MIPFAVLCLGHTLWLWICLLFLFALCACIVHAIYVCVCVWCPNLKYPMTFKVGLPICLFTIGIEFPTMGKSFSSKPYDPSEGA